MGGLNACLEAGGHSPRAALLIAYRTSMGETQLAPLLGRAVGARLRKGRSCPQRAISFTAAIALSHNTKLMGVCPRAVGAEDPQGSQDSVVASEVPMCPWHLQVYP
ncbi:hypothetical protein J3F83DRAFT_189845 [Trichoderma novae-zelandiae]